MRTKASILRHVYAVLSVVYGERAFRDRLDARPGSFVRPGVPDGRDHVRGRRVFRASLLHVVHQSAVLAFIRVEI